MSWMTNYWIRRKSKIIWIWGGIRSSIRILELTSFLNMFVTPSAHAPYLKKQVLNTARYLTSLGHSEKMVVCLKFCTSSQRFFFWSNEFKALTTKSFTSSSYKINLKNQHKWVVNSRICNNQKRVRINLSIDGFNRIPNLNYLVIQFSTYPKKVIEN